MYIKRGKVIFEASDFLGMTPDGKYIYAIKHDEDVQETKTSSKPLHTKVHEGKMKRMRKKITNTASQNKTIQL